jgi:hypothetical protein
MRKRKWNNFAVIEKIRERENLIPAFSGRSKKLADPASATLFGDPSLKIRESTTNKGSTFR